MATDCYLTEDWAYLKLTLDPVSTLTSFSGFDSYDDSTPSNFISTIIVLTDFRNSLGAQRVESTDPTTFELFLTDDDPSEGGLDVAQRTNAKYSFKFKRGELT